MSDPQTNGATIKVDDSTEQQQEEQKQPHSTSNNNDLVFLDGFPVLLSNDGTPDVTSNANAVIPQHSIWTSSLQFVDNQTTTMTLREDCVTVCTARSRSATAAYSEGVTYFMPCVMSPRCALEELVLSIFFKHTEHLREGTYRKETSGAEWWTLVLDDDDEHDTKCVPDKHQYKQKSKEEREEEKAPKAHKDTNSTEEQDAASEAESEEEEGDDVGMHFDADYGLESQAPGLLLHPRVATVTYLSDFGSPTVVVNRKSPPPHQIKELHGTVDCVWLSHPFIGKHMAFDGRLLHGAPSTFFPPREKARKVATGEDVVNKKTKVDGRRITLLVNVWLNHCPLDAEPLEEEIITQLATPFPSSTRTNPWFCFSPSLDVATGSAPSSQVQLELDPNNPAGSEEVVICDRLVTVHYGASMESIHAACAREGELVQVNFGRESLRIEVGDPVVDHKDESEEESTDREQRHQVE